MRQFHLFLILSALVAASAPVPGSLPQAFAQSPEQIQVGDFVNKGNAFLRARRFPEAIQQYEKALQIDGHCVVAQDNIAEAHNNWGIYFFQQHKWKEALGHFNKCIELAPGHANAKRNIGICNQAMSRLGLDENGNPPTAPPQAGGTTDGDRGTVAEFNPLDGQPIERPKAGAKPPVAGTKGAPGAGHPNASDHPASGDKPGVGGQSQSTPSGASFASTAAATPVNGRVQEGRSAPTAEDLPAGATVLTPGLRVGAGSRSGGDTFTTGGATDSYRTPSAGATLLPNVSARTENSGAPSAPPANPYSSPNMGYPSGPSIVGGSGTAPVNSSSYPSGSSPVGGGGAAASTPVPTPTPYGVQSTPQLPPPSAPPVEPVAVRPAPAGNSVDEQLSAVEMKMYGQSQSNLNVMQRLEKMERDVSGQVRSGSIFDRINYLKQSIGM